MCRRFRIPVARRWPVCPPLPNVNASSTAAITMRVDLLALSGVKDTVLPVLALRRRVLVVLRPAKVQSSVELCTAVASWVRDTASTVHRLKDERLMRATTLSRLRRLSTKGYVCSLSDVLVLYAVLTVKPTCSGF